MQMKVICASALFIGIVAFLAWHWHAVHQPIAGDNVATFPLSNNASPTIPPVPLAVLPAANGVTERSNAIPDDLPALVAGAPARAPGTPAIADTQFPNLSPKATVATGPAEMHVVALRASGYLDDAPFQVEVVVNRPGRPVTLVLGADHSAVTWSVTAAPGSQITRILLAGSAPQFLSAHPADSIVENHFYKSVNRNGYIDLKADPTDPEFQSAISRIQHLTGADIAEFDDSHSIARGQPADNPLTITIDHVENDPHFARSYPTLTPLGPRPALPMFFRAIENQLRPTYHFGSMSLDGTVASTGEALDPLNFAPAYDPQSGAVFALQFPNTLVQVHPGQGFEAYAAPRPLAVPRGTYIPHLAIDSRRKRIIADVMGSLQILSPESSTLEPFTKAQLETPNVICYDADRDHIFVLSMKNYEFHESFLFELDAQGNLVKRSILQEPFFSGSLGVNAADLKQLMTDQGKLIYVIQYAMGIDRLDAPLPPYRTLVYQINPDQGTALLVGKQELEQ